MRYIALVISLLANISLYAFSFSEYAYEILRLTSTSTFTAREIIMMEECVKADDRFSPVLDCMKEGKALNLETQVLLYDSLREQLELEGTENEDYYRLVLYGVMSSRLCELNYPECLLVARELIENIKEYVSDSEMSRQWLMLVDCQIPDFLRADCTWSASNAAFRACQYVDEHGVGEDNLGLRLGINAINYMYAGHYYLADLEGLYRKLKSFVVKQYPNSTDAQDWVELQYICAKLALSPEDKNLNQRRWHLVDHCRRIPSDYFDALMALSADEMYRGDSIASLKYETHARSVLDSLATNADYNCEVYNFDYAFVAAQSICLAVAMDNKSKAMANLRQVKLYYDSIDTPEAWRAMLYVYNSMRNLDLSKYEQDSIAADMYNYALKESDDEIRAISLINAACVEGGRGRIDSACKMLDLSRDAASWCDSSELLLAAINNVEGSLLFTTPQIDKAETEVLSALDYYVSHDMADYYLGIYGFIAWKYNCLGNLSKAVEYAKKYWDGVSRLNIPPYSFLTDFNVQRILINEKTNLQERINATERLLKLADEKGFGYISSSLHHDIAQLYELIATSDAIERAREHYEVGYRLIVEYGESVWDLQGYLENFLNFLQQTGDKKRHDEIIAALISDTEKLGNIINLQYLRILANELVSAVNSDNLTMVNYYLFKNQTIFNRLTDQVQGDQHTLMMSAGVIFPSVVYAMSGFLNKYMAIEGKDVALDDFKRVFNFDFDFKEAIDEVQRGYAENVNDRDYNYTSLLLAKTNWLIATGELSHASEVLDSLAVNPFYNYVGEARDFFPGLRCQIAEKLGDYQEVARLLELPEMTSALERAEWGMEINQLSNLCNRLSLSYHRQGMDEKAMEIVLRRQNIVLDFIVNQYAALSENERYVLVDNGIVTPNDIYWMLQHHQSEDSRRKAYNGALMSRGILLESSDMQRRAIFASGDSSLIADYYNLAGMKREMTNKRISNTLNEQYAKIQELEADIMLRSASLSDMQLRRKADWKSVAKSLKNNEAAVEFVAFRDPDEGFIWKFAALVLRRDMKAPEYVSLINYPELQSVTGVTKANAKTTIKNIYAYNKNGNILYHKLWEPLEKYLDGVDRIYYTTSGDLSTLSFAAIEDSTRTPLCRRYDLRQLSSTAQLCSNEYNRSNKRGIVDFVAVGGINYDADVTKAESRKGEWPPLNMSLAEINFVDTLCQEIPSVMFEKKFGLDPTEKYIRSFSGKSPDIIHMSTHGFFKNSEDASKAKFYINKEMTNDTVPNTNISSLSRGGLIFANANPVWNNEETAPDVSDGILTGTELAELDFSNTDLMVLSACQTGLGDCTITEGINGLQRAVKLAGVKSMVVSMWVVSDKAGMEFMGSFYRNLLKEEKDRHEAFRCAQLEMQEKYPREPFYWAPFVMID